MLEYGTPFTLWRHAVLFWLLLPMSALGILELVRREPVWLGPGAVVPGLAILALSAPRQGFFCAIGNSTAVPSTISPGEAILFVPLGRAFHPTSIHEPSSPIASFATRTCSGTRRKDGAGFKRWKSIWRWWRRSPATRANAIRSQPVCPAIASGIWCTETSRAGASDALTGSLRALRYRDARSAHCAR